MEEGFIVGLVGRLVDGDGRSYNLVCVGGWWTGSRGTRRGRSSFFCFQPLFVLVLNLERWFWVGWVGWLVSWLGWVAWSGG